MLFGYENRSHPLGHSEKKCRLTGGIFAWESVFSTEKRIATPVCGLVRNDSVLLTERHYHTSRFLFVYSTILGGSRSSL